MTKLLHLLRSEKAATAIEYGLIAALICLGAMTAIIAFSDANKNVWNNVSTKSTNAMNF